MFNALWFRPEGGAERYAEYGAAVLPILADVGAELVTPFLPVARRLEGEVDADLVGFVRYPSEDAFDAMWTSDAYQRIAHLRTEAVTKAILTRCEIDPPEAGPASVQGGVAVLNALWFHPGGAARYDEYLDAARPMVEARGGRFVTPRFRPVASLAATFQPDLLLLGHYPSADAVFDLVGDEAYQRGPAAIRAAAVARSATSILSV